MLIRALAGVVVAMLLGTTACNPDRSTAADASLSVEASISDATIGSDESATITYRLRNHGPYPRTVAVSCVPEIRIADERGANVFPGDVGFICTLVPHRPETFAPGEELIRTFSVSGPSGTSSIRLPVGRYTAEAEFTIGLGSRRRTYPLRSGEISFAVVP